MIKNLYFYTWDREYMDAAAEADRVSINLREAEYDNVMEDMDTLKKRGVQIFAYIPVLCRTFQALWTAEAEKIFDGIYVSNIGQISWALSTGKSVYGDAGLNVFNLETANVYRKHGLKGVTCSHELDQDVNLLLDKADPEDDFEYEVLRYGRIPAMVSEYCPLAGGKQIKGSHCGSCEENNPVFLKDNLGERYPVILESEECTALILSKNALNRKNSSSGLRKLKGGVERICVSDETPSFIRRA